MSNAVNYPMATTTKISPEEYLRLEREAVVKSEYVDGTIVPMSGATREHNLIETNIVGELHYQLKHRDCEVYGGNMKVRVPISYRYPDATVVCGKPLFEDIETDVLLNPTVVFEVLSKSTEIYDRGDKFAEYRQRESLQVYVLVSQLMPRIEIYRRQGNDWLFSEVNGLEKTLSLEAIGCELKLSEVYEKVDFGRAEQS
jgi:Uma2 family endonuclease